MRGIADSPPAALRYRLSVPSIQLAPSLLIVDDNAAMRALIRSLVEGVGTTVHECADGETALALYPEVHPDWVLMDIKMSGLDGISTSRALLQSHPEARIIIITEHREEEYRHAAFHAGASGFVLKQDILTLPAVLERLIRENGKIVR